MMPIREQFISLQGSWFKANRLPDFHSETTALYDFHAYFAQLFWGLYSDSVQLFTVETQEEKASE